MAEPSIIDRRSQRREGARLVENPSSTPVHYRDLADFLDRIAAEASLEGETAAPYAVSAMAVVLRRHISPGEIDDVRATLPEELRAILD